MPRDFDTPARGSRGARDAPRKRTHSRLPDAEQSHVQPPLESGRDISSGDYRRHADPAEPMRSSARPGHEQPLESTHSEPAYSINSDTLSADDAVGAPLSKESPVRLRVVLECHI